MINTEIINNSTFSAKQPLRKKCPNTDFFLVHIFSYSVSIQENTNQKKNSIFGHFLHSELFYKLD